MPLYEIYRLISPSNKSYIGFTSRGFTTRYKEHIRYWKQGRIACTKLYTAFDKYHPDLWKHEILFYTEIRNEAEQKEVDFIKLYDTINNGYNIFSGGGLSRLGIKLTEKELKRNRESHIGLKLSDITKQRMSKSRIGKVQKDTTKEKIRLAHIGMKYSDKVKRKLSNFKKVLAIIKRNKMEILTCAV